MLFQQVAPFDGQPGLGRSFKGRLDQDAGHVARLVLALIGHQVHALLARIAAPADEILVGHPQIRAAGMLPAGGIGGRGHGDIAAAILGHEAGPAVTLVVGGHRYPLHLGINGLPASVGLAKLPVTNRLPVALVEDQLDLSVGRWFGLPIDRDHLYRRLRAGHAHAVASPHPDVGL